ncbi:WXG100 family type VII secretion target [Nocardia sp. NPDC057440]|uniref:WXG100 family type VII secretion target n=1 Tax=Nocardia sp. NPDC057440 TaxID=3346134 RepID=UPI00366C7362
MSSRFSVDLEHLDEIVARLSGLAGFIGEHLDEIDDRVATLSDTGWEGVAAQAYAEAHTQWVTGAREFVEGVKGHERCREGCTRALHPCRRYQLQNVQRGMIHHGCTGHRLADLLRRR